VAILLLHGQQEGNSSLILMISSLVTRMLDKKDKSAAESPIEISRINMIKDSIISVSINCLNAICSFIKNERKTVKVTKKIIEI
jgi:hypothetical protein